MAAVGVCWWKNFVYKDSLRESRSKLYRNANVLHRQCRCIPTAAYSPKPPSPYVGCNRSDDINNCSIRILTRGEVLEDIVPFFSSENVEVLLTDERLNRLEGMGSKVRHNVIAFYAGSTVVASPPPSSLPVPAFFSKKPREEEYDLTCARKKILCL